MTALCVRAGASVDRICRGRRNLLRCRTLRRALTASAPKIPLTRGVRPGNSAARPASSAIIEAVGPSGVAGPRHRPRRRPRARRGAGYHQESRRSIDLQRWNWLGLGVVNAHERDLAVYAEGIRRALDLIASASLESHTSLPSIRARRAESAFRSSPVRAHRASSGAHRLQRSGPMSTAARTAVARPARRAAHQLPVSAGSARIDSRPSPMRIRNDRSHRRQQSHGAVDAAAGTGQTSMANASGLDDFRALLDMDLDGTGSRRPAPPTRRKRVSARRRSGGVLQKPLARTLHEARSVVETARERSAARRGFRYRHVAGVPEMRCLISSGGLGAGAVDLVFRQRVWPRQTLVLRRSAVRRRLPDGSRDPSGRPAAVVFDYPALERFTRTSIATASSCRVPFHGVENYCAVELGFAPDITARLLRRSTASGRWRTR